MENFKKYLNKINGGDILDIACGIGWFSKFILDSINDYNSLTGIDVKENYRDKFLETVSYKNVKYEVESIYEYINSGNKFDTVLISFSLHHLNKIEEILKNISRLLKEDGVVIIREMFSGDLEEHQLTQKMFHELGARLDTVSGVFHDKIYSIEKIENLVSLCNFKKVDKFIIKNNEYINNDPKEHKELMGYMEKKISDIYGEDIPKEILDEKKNIEEKLDKFGIGEPAYIIIVGKY